MRAWIYTRNSSGAERSVEEQETEARAVCDREGWQVDRVVTDMVGASRHSKGNRVGWKSIEKALANGQIDVLVTWECSRANRDLSAYAELRDLCVTHGVLWNYSGKTHDMATSGDRFRTGLDALLAEREADEIAERVQRAMRSNAAKGRPHGRRLYGYQRTYDPTTGALVGQTPHPAEAAVVRSIFADYLSGTPIRTIARRLTDEGVRTTKGTPWRDAQVRNVLLRPSYAGKRVHRGEIVGEAVWEPLVSWETFQRVQARIEASAARQVRYSETARLLTGVAKCGKCGARMFVGHDRGGRKVYQCRACFGCVRDEEKVDRFVSAQIIERLHDLPDVRPAPQVDEAAVLRRRLDEAVGQFTAGHLTAGTLARIESELLPAIAKLEAERRRQMVPIDIDVPAGGIESWWHDQITPGQRRAIATALISVVTILPAVRGSRTFDPSKVVVDWAS